MCKYFRNTPTEPGGLDICDEVAAVAGKMALENGRPEDEPNEEDFERAGEEVHPYVDPDSKYDMDSEV